MADTPQDALTSAAREVLGRRFSELRAELQPYELTIGVSAIGVSVTLPTIPLLQDAACALLRARGNAELAARSMAAFNGFLAALQEFAAADHDNALALEAVDAAEETFEHVQAEVNHFLETLPES